MIIQKMLKRGEVTLKGLQALLGMMYKQYPEGYVTITYDQFETPSASRVAAQCRGVIFDEDYNIVCRPFDRFFNHGEPAAPQGGIDFSRAKIVDKLDGSLIKIWFDVKALQWRVATSGRIYGESDVSDHGFTYKELVYRALNVNDDNEFNDRCATFDINTTYIYEVTSRETRIVTRYEVPELWYLAARKNKCGTYIDFDGSIIGAKLPKQYDLATIEDCIKAAKELKNFEEGYVIYVDNVPTLKIKSPAYVQAHLIKGEDLSVGRVCTLILNNEIDEYLTYFPEDRHRIMPYFDGLQNFYTLIENDFAEVAHIEDKIEFAKAVKNNKYQSLLFSMKQGNNVKEAFNRLLNPSKRKIIKEFKVV